MTSPGDHSPTGRDDNELADALDGLSRSLRDGSGADAELVEAWPVSGVTRDPGEITALAQDAYRVVVERDSRLDAIGVSYAHGVRDALLWVLGQPTLQPVAKEAIRAELGRCRPGGGVASPERCPHCGSGLKIGGFGSTLKGIPAEQVGWTLFCVDDCGWQAQTSLADARRRGAEARRQQQ